MSGTGARLAQRRGTRTFTQQPLWSGFVNAVFLGARSNRNSRIRITQPVDHLGRLVRPNAGCRSSALANALTAGRSR
jgi:hypothetical protein